MIMEEPPVEALDRLALSSTPVASFSSLPYELVALIASYLDPSLLLSSHEAPSITRLRREAGRSLSLVSRNAREVGTELVWRRVVVGFHRNPDLLRRVSEEKWMAEYVKQLHVVCSPKSAAAALEMDAAEVLPLFTALDELSLAATPPVLEHFLLPLSSSLDLAANLTRLELISSFGSSPTFPSFLLNHLPLFTFLSSLTLDIRLPLDTELHLFPPCLSPTRPRPPLSRVRNLSLTIENAPPPTYPIISSFLSALSSLINFRRLRTCSIYSPYTDDSLLSSFLSHSSSSLTSLTLSLSIGPLIARLPSLLDLLPSLTRLKSLKILVQPHLDAPLIFPSSHAFRRKLFSSLSGLEELETVELDFDLMDSSPVRQGSDTALFLASRLRAGAGGEGGEGRSKLRTWQTVEWEETLRLRRVVVAVRRMKEEGGEEWELVQENLEDDG